jgi:lipopolysaccharide export system protein LptA
MTTRRVIDAKDKDGEKVYVKGHAKATYMSDGRTVEDAIKQIGTGGGGGGGITVETDPIFSASPAAGITEKQIVAWDDLAEMVNLLDKDVATLTGDVQEVQESLTDLDTIRSGAAKGATAVQPGAIEDVARLDEEYVVANGIVSKEDVYYHLPGINPDDTAHTLATKDDVSSAIETYVADFTMEELRQGAYNGVDVNCQVRFLIQAMNENKVVLVRESTDSSYKGVYVLNGYAEDMLYFSIVDTNGEIIFCDGIDYSTDNPVIQASSLRRRSFDEKQDALVSGTNIKTINGENILGEGDMLVGKITYFSEEDIIELSPNVVWLRRGSVVNSVQITGFASNGKDYEEYAYHFYTGTIADGSVVKLILPKGVKYANKEIFDALESDTHYELSVVRSNGVVKAVLTAFK